MKPLEEWICDKCGGLIKRKEDGWLEWLDDHDHKAHSFRIVHHDSASPLSSCYFHTREIGLSDNHLSYYLGASGLANLLTFLDMGDKIDPDARHVPRVKDLREFVELFRRLTIPYYEEARLYWASALDDGFFEGANEISIYQPDALQNLIAQYGQT